MDVEELYKNYRPLLTSLSISACRKVFYGRFINDPLLFISMPYYRRLRNII